MVTQITSAKNPKVKHAYALRERRERDREGVTILEGYRELSRALALGIRIRECFCCPYSIANSFRKALETVLTNCPECAKSDCKSWRGRIENSFNKLAAGI